MTRKFVGVTPAQREFVAEWARELHIAIDGKVPCVVLPPMPTEQTRRAQLFPKVWIEESLPPEKD